MKRTNLIAIALVTLLVAAGSAAAAPNQTTINTGAHTPATAAAHPSGANASVTGSVSIAANHSRDQNASDAPPTTMPDNASARVGPLHGLIHEKLSGVLSGRELGAQIRALFGVGGHAGVGTANTSNAAADHRPATPSVDGSPAANGQAGSNARAAANGSAHAQGSFPSIDLPQQAANGVSQLHAAISAFLSGDGSGSLGATVHGIVGGSHQG